MGPFWVHPPDVAVDGCRDRREIRAREKGAENQGFADEGVIRTLSDLGSDYPGAVFFTIWTAFAPFGRAGW
jgi:hypothetical protein